MLSIGKLAAGPGAGRYYVDQVAQGREDYYSAEGEAPGRWIGAGAAKLGLEGDVADDELLSVLAGCNRRLGEDLGRPLGAGDVAGFDLTFRAPKSVSILFGIGDGQLAAQLRNGHEAAVAEALAFLEREACIVRRGKGGAIQLAGSGYIVAAYRHRSSRAGDPLLHTHVVVANRAEGPDGRFTALFGKAVYAHSKTAGYLYQAVLRRELTDRLGLDWQPVVNGAADVKGVPRAVIEEFSQRRREILATMARRGEHSARAAQVATLDTRRAKPHQPLARADQPENWRARAAEHYLLPQTLDRLTGRRLKPLPHGPDHEAALADQLLGEHGLTEQRSTFDRGSVIQACAHASPRGAHVDELEQQAYRLLADSRVLALDGGRYSTRDLVDIELSLLHAQAERRDEPATPVSPDAVRRATEQRGLSEEQTAMVEQLVLGPGGVQVVRAPAGAGKTFALDAAREAWQQARVPVLGCALSARAACELRDQAAIDATTIARLRLAIEDGSGLQPDSVLIVDEAGMAGTRDLAVLSHAAGQANARLILVGDDRQLPEIDAGGAFAALARQGPTVELREVRRQREQWDRDALAQLRDGDLDAVTTAYIEHDRIITTPDAATARERLVEDWWEASQAGQDALMLANRRVDVADLNQRARERLRDAGQLGPEALQCGERYFAIGDRVLATKNDRALDVHNGQTGHIVEISGSELHIELAGKQRLPLPLGYAHDGHLDHAYAMTVHKTQGATVDSVFVLGSDAPTANGATPPYPATATRRGSTSAASGTTSTPRPTCSLNPRTFAAPSTAPYVVAAANRSPSITPSRTAADNSSTTRRRSHANSGA